LTDTVPDILARIVAAKREELPRVRERLAEWEREGEARNRTRRDFRGALLSHSPAIISEIKKASPSKGLLAADFDPARTAAAYARGGAAALSVLTDERYFQGSLRDLQMARAAVELPVLRKDFTIDPAQIAQAAAHGADAILLIAAILSERELLVEVHNRRELDAAVAAGSQIIGVNNRDLATFHVTLETSLRLAGHIPDGAVRVSESGIHNAADVAALRAAGFQAFLVGEHLMKAADPAAALRELVAA